MPAHRPAQPARRPAKSNTARSGHATRSANDPNAPAPQKAGTKPPARSPGTGSTTRSPKAATGSRLAPPIRNNDTTMSARSARATNSRTTSNTQHPATNSTSTGERQRHPSPKSPLTPRYSLAPHQRTDAAARMTRPLCSGPPHAPALHATFRRPGPFSIQRRCCGHRTGVGDGVRLVAAVGPRRPRVPARLGERGDRPSLALASSTRKAALSSSDSSTASRPASRRAANSSRILVRRSATFSAPSSRGSSSP